MAHPPSSAIPPRAPSGAPRSSSSLPAFGPEDFPGCLSFHFPAADLERYQGRLEFWDGRTEIAWRVPDTPIWHEALARRLAALTADLEMLRGSQIMCLGSSDLVRRDAAGRKRWLIQADEIVYLHPDRSRPCGTVIDVDADPLPDVVLEVDYVTDVRCRKLSIYADGGFPEVWVLAPPESPHACAGADDSRPYRRRRLSRGLGERGAPGLADTGDLPSPDGDPDAGASVARPRAGGAGDGSARGHAARGRPDDEITHAPVEGGKRG